MLITSAARRNESDPSLWLSMTGPIGWPNLDDGINLIA
jgi:hypothetical protein